MNDIEWERTSDSWKALIPKRNFNTFDLSDESEEDQWKRLESRFHIPLNVVKQWLYPLYYNQNSTNNYGWLNFDNIEFLEEELSYEELLNVYVIDGYKSYVDDGARYKAYDKLPCVERDKEYWRKESTWRVPPIILDVKSISDRVPEHAEIKGPLQLVEGHSRLGYLFAAKNSGVLQKNNHKIYLMRYKK